MQRFYCYVCQSAGSVNQWGFCEICGEEHVGSKLNDDWFVSIDRLDAEPYEGQTVGDTGPGFETKEPAASIRQDAA